MRFLFSIISILFLSTPILLSQEVKIDSLLKSLETQPPDTNRIKTLIRIVRYYNKNEPLKAIPFGKEAVELADKTNILKFQIPANSGLGVTYYFLAYQNKAIELFLKVLKACESNQDTSGIAKTLNNIGLVYDDSKDYDKAISYYQNSLDIKLKIKDTETLWTTYANIGLAFQAKKEYKLAMHNFLMAIESWKQLNQEKDENYAVLISDLGNTFQLLGNLEKADSCLTEAIYYQTKTKSIYREASSFLYLAQIHFKKRNLAKALIYLDSAQQFAKSSGATNVTIEVLEQLSEIEKYKGNYKKAFELINRFHALKDSVEHARNLKEINQLQEIYQLEKQENENELLKKENELNKTKLSRRNAILFGFTGTLIILIIFTTQLYNLYRKRRIVNQKLEEQQNIILNSNEELSLQKEAILNQANELKHINEQLEKLSIVASQTDNVVMICDSQGEIHWVNDSFKRLYHLDLNSLITNIGSNIADFSMHDSIKEIMEECRQTRKSIIYVSTFQKSEEESVWFQTTLTPILNQQNEIQSLIAISTDITQIKNAEEKIRFINGQINASIEYAKSIQGNILPEEQELNKVFENFIIYRPKDIVSGDFYWFLEQSFHNSTFQYVAVVDCTGHGVPAAFMSLVGCLFLNQIIQEHHIAETNLILDKLDEMINKLLHQQINENTDGMDMVICRIENINKLYKIQISNANNRLIIRKNESFETIKIDHRSIGGAFLNKKPPLKYINIELNSGDLIYLYTDGLIDQNNALRRRFGTAQFLDLIKQISSQEMEFQKKVICENLDHWMGSQPQRDDITLWGIRLR